MITGGGLIQTGIFMNVQFKSLMPGSLGPLLHHCMTAEEYPATDIAGTNIPANNRESMIFFI
jgi:hypothetical protein